MDKTLKAFLKSQDLHPKQLYKLAPGTLIEDFLKFQKQQQAIWDSEELVFDVEHFSKLVNKDKINKYDVKSTQ